MVEHTLLEYDEKTRYALVMTSLTAPHPFVECYGYDLEAREWSQGSYFSTLEEAVVAYNRSIGGVNLYIEPDDVFCDIKWCREDVLSFLTNHYGVEWATEENVDRAIASMGKCFKDRCIEDGWETMCCSVDEGDLVAPEKKQS